MEEIVVVALRETTRSADRLLPFAANSRDTLPRRMVGTGSAMTVRLSFIRGGLAGRQESRASMVTAIGRSPSGTP
jgi:hypothetical protein